MSQRNLAVRLLISAKDEASGVLGGLRRNAGKVAAAIAGYFGIKMFAGAISSAADFQEQMSTVQAVTGATTEEMDLLRKAADEAGTNTRYTATQAGQALEQLARAGLNARQSVETLPSVLALAQGNGLELGQAAGFITQAVRGMGLEFDQAGRVADVLAKGAASANTTVEGLGNALSYAAPTANALGLELEDTVAIIGKLADAGIDASRAGTALNSILAQFSDPASKFRQELGNIGIYTNDFNDALEQLAAKGDDGQKAIRAVGLEAGPALQALLSQGIGSLKELRAALKDAEGSAALAAAIMDSNLNGALRGLSSAWESVKLTLVKPLLDPIAEQVNRLSSRLRSFVSEGVIQRAGEILGSMFIAAQASFNNFLDNFDLDQVIQQLKVWLDQTKETVDGWIASLTTAKDTASLVWNTMAAGIHTITAVFQTFGAVVTNVMYRVVDGLGYGLKTLGFFSSTAREIGAQIREAASDLESVSDGLLEGAQESINSATESANAAQEAFARLRAGTEETTVSAASAGEAIKDLSTVNLELTGTLIDTRDAAEGAAAGIDSVTDSATDSEEEMAKAEVAAAKLAFAYEELGITSQTALDEAAERARNSFETIKNSGQATTRELQQAFQAYAQRAIEANNGVASYALKAEASQNGLKLTADETGRVIVEAMGAAAKATSDIKNAADSASSSYRRMAQDAQKAGSASNQTNSNSANENKDKDEDDSNSLDGTRRSGGTFMAGKYSMADLKSLDAELANRAAQAVADLNKNLASDGSSTYYRKTQYETAMRRIESAADAIKRKNEAEASASKNERSEPSSQSSVAINSLDDIAKAMEQALAKAIPQAQAASKKTEVTLNLPTGKFTGMFDDTEADRLIRSLSDMARISR